MLLQRYRICWPTFQAIGCVWQSRCRIRRLPTPPEEVALADGKLVSRKEVSRAVSIADAMRHGAKCPALGFEGVNAVAGFVEKPDLTTAARYVVDGYLWNSGNFLFRAEDPGSDNTGRGPGAAAGTRRRG
jgi:Nucleotidyl transferase